MMSKKQQVLLALFEICQMRQNYIFDNDMVENACRQVGFKNKFDVTKLDNETLIPDALREQGFAVIHKGRGQHEFVRALTQVYHHFEPIQNESIWLYRKSLLNEYNSSEANILSVANNQRILHHFLFGIDNTFANYWLGTGRETG